MRFLFIILFLFNILFNALSQQKDIIYSTPINITQINTESDDFAPIYNKYDNLIYFNSTISGTSQFYITKKLDSINFDTPRRLNDELNEKYRNQSYITFASKDLAYLSAYRLSESRSYINIFQTEYKKKNWIKSFLVESLSSESFTAHPTISKDGNTLIFSSNRNSENDTDLWVTYRNPDGTWSNAVNLTELNSSKNEITPFLLSDDTLFFASNGLGGKGGYDLFISVKVNGIWQSPEPLSQFNTEWDESDLTMLPDHSIIFASNRPGGKGGLDLYYSRVINNERIEIFAVNDIELSIATQTTSITITKNTNISKVFFPNIILLNSSNNELNINNINNLNINNYDNLLDNTLNILLFRILNTNSKGLSLDIYYESNSDNFKKIKDFIVNVITKNTNIDTSNIKINFYNTNEYSTYILNLAKNKFDILIKYELFNEIVNNTIQINNDSYSIEPSILELFFDSRPRTSTERIYYYLLIDNQIIFKSDAIKSLPEEKMFNLHNYENDLWNSDSLEIILEAYDKSNSLKSKKLILDINKVERGKINTITSRNTSYDIFNILISSNEDINSLSFVNFLKSIRPNNPYYNDSLSVVISYPENFKKDEVIESITKMVKNTFNNRAIIDIVSNKNYNFDDNFQKSVYSILVKNN